MIGGLFCVLSLRLAVFASRSAVGSLLRLLFHPLGRAALLRLGSSLSGCRRLCRETRRPFRAVSPSAPVALDPLDPPPLLRLRCRLALGRLPECARPFNAFTALPRPRSGRGFISARRASDRAQRGRAVGRA